MIEEALLVTQVGMFLFIVAGMAAMGLSLTVPRIVEPLRDLRMVGLLMVVTVVYAPIVVPLVVEGATVEAWDIASSLIVLMLIPLGAGLFVKARYEEFADSIVGQAGQISSTGLMVGIVAALLVSWQDVFGAIGSWVFIGVAIVLVAALVVGYICGVGRSQNDMIVLAWPPRSATSRPRW